MKLLIDADACPVVEICLEQARKRGIPVTLYCDTSHILRHEDAETVVVSKGADSADFALVNALAPGDLAVTQDYGLAAMCLSRKAPRPAAGRAGIYRRQHRLPAAGAAHGAQDPPGRRPSARAEKARCAAGRGV